MNGYFSIVAAVLLKTGIALFIANEIRGVILAVPILYGMYAAGGTLMAIWLGLCSLGGVALSVVVPLFIGRKLKLIGPSARHLGADTILHCVPEADRPVVTCGPRLFAAR